MKPTGGGRRSEIDGNPSEHNYHSLGDWLMETTPQKTFARPGRGDDRFHSAEPARRLAGSA
jgi:hypothetical protein